MLGGGALVRAIAPLCVLLARAVAERCTPALAANGTWSEGAVREWTPAGCDIPRIRNASAFRRLCPRVGAWVVFAGDSASGRNTYCLLYTVLNHGTVHHSNDFGDPEQVGCGGLYPIALKPNATYTYPNHDSPFNETHCLRSSATIPAAGRIFHFESAGVRFSWAYTMGLDYSSHHLHSVLLNVSTASPQPNHVVVGAGSWDYFVRDASEFPKILDERQAGALALANLTRAVFGAPTRLWYRTHTRSDSFPADEADVRVVRTLREAGWGIIPLYELSVAHRDQYVDGLHYDRHPWIHHTHWNSTSPHVGELDTAVLDAVLNALC